MLGAFTTTSSHSEWFMTTPINTQWFLIHCVKRDVLDSVTEHCGLAKASHTCCVWNVHRSEAKCNIVLFSPLNIPRCVLDITQIEPVRLSDPIPFKSLTLRKNTLICHNIKTTDCLSVLKYSLHAHNCQHDMTTRHMQLYCHGPWPPVSGHWRYPSTKRQGATQSLVPRASCHYKQGSTWVCLSLTTKQRFGFHSGKNKMWLSMVYSMVQFRKTLEWTLLGSGNDSVCLLSDRTLHLNPPSYSTWLHYCMSALIMCI